MQHDNHMLPCHIHHRLQIGMQSEVLRRAFSLVTTTYGINNLLYNGVHITIINIGKQLIPPFSVVMH